MPDPITNSCNAMPPITVSANPPPSSQEEIVIFGCAPKVVRPPVLTGARARSEISKQCSKLKLSSATTKSLIKSLKLSTGGSRPAGPPSGGWACTRARTSSAGRTEQWTIQ